LLPLPVLRGRVGVGVFRIADCGLKKRPHPCPPPEYREREDGELVRIRLARAFFIQL